MKASSNYRKPLVFASGAQRHTTATHPLGFTSIVLLSFCNFCIFSSSHQRRTMHQKEQRIHVVRKRRMLQGAVTRTKGPWSLMRRTRGEEINEKQRNPQR